MPCSGAQLLETADFGSRTNSGPSWTCRLVSRRFYAVATPLCYRELKLTDGIVASAVAPNVVDHDEWDVDLESSAIYQGRTASRGLANIFTYTEHVLAGSDLDVRGVKAVLRGATKLTTVT